MRSQSSILLSDMGSHHLLPPVVYINRKLGTGSQARGLTWADAFVPATTALVEAADGESENLKGSGKPVASSWWLFTD